MIFPRFALAERGCSLLPSGLCFKGWPVHPHTDTPTHTPTLPDIQAQRWPSYSSPHHRNRQPPCASLTWALAAYKELFHLWSSPSPGKQQWGCPGPLPGGAWHMVGPGAATEHGQLLPRPHSWIGIGKKNESNGLMGGEASPRKSFPACPALISLPLGFP